MSLSQLVLRHLTVLALLDKTLAGAEVQSSSLEPITAESAEAVPVIAVFTDGGTAQKDDIQGRDIMAADYTTVLALEIACVASVPTADQQGVETFIPQTDEGMEMTLDVIERQAIAELQSGSSNWSDLWRAFAGTIVTLRAERGASIEKGTRFAARRFEIHCKTMGEPVPGSPLPPKWEEVFAAFEAEPKVRKFVPLLRSIATGDAVTDWKQVQQALGLASDEVAALGIMPFDEAAPESATALIAEDEDLNIDITVTAGGATDGDNAVAEASDGE